MPSTWSTVIFDCVPKDDADGPVSWKGRQSITHLPWSQLGKDSFASRDDTQYKATWVEGEGEEPGIWHVVATNSDKTVTVIHLDEAKEILGYPRPSLVDGGAAQNKAIEFPTSSLSEIPVEFTPSHRKARRPRKVPELRQPSTSTTLNA